MLARYTQIGDQLQELAASRAEEAARAKRAGARKLAVAKERIEVTDRLLLRAG